MDLNRVEIGLHGSLTYRLRWAEVDDNDRYMVQRAITSQLDTIGNKAGRYELGKLGI